jgi:DNA-binding transcriptional MerR regulator/effector-binding domain-containing protein
MALEYQIGDFSQITRLTVKTLRFYQEEGILLPTRTDPFTGYRYYADSSVERARLIRELRELEFSVREIREIVQSCGEDEDLLPFVERKRREIDEKLRDYRKIKGRLDEVIKAEKERISVGKGNNEIAVVDIGPQWVVSKRFKGKYGEVGKYIGGLFKAAGGSTAGKVFSMYYDGDYRETDADIEICVLLKKEIKLGASAQKDGIAQRELAGGKFLKGTHFGPYETIGETYQELMDYAGQKGIKLATPCREIYIKGPGMLFRGNPKNYVTELIIPIA